MTKAESWKRSADSAAAVHQIRNRLQSIIIETALLKRMNGSCDLTALGRISALAQDGAGYLDLFGELSPPPDLVGCCEIQALQSFVEDSVDSSAERNQFLVRCDPEAFEALGRMLVAEAIPFRGFRPVRLLPATLHGDRVEITIELEPKEPAKSESVVTPWMTTQQMVRDAGGSLELQSGSPPVVRLSLPAATGTK